MASGISTFFSRENPNELCDRLKLLIQGKQVGINSNKINEESVSIVEKFLDYDCISKKQRKILLLKSLK